MDLLDLRAPLVETIMMDKGGIIKITYEHLLVENTRTDEIVRSVVLEFGIQCSSSQ